MNRRTFLRTGAAGLAAAPLSALSNAATQEGASSATKPAGKRFGLSYAPHFGMFKAHAGGDVHDQLRFMADEGFDALEDNWMSRRKPEEQEAIAATMQQLDMRMGVFVAHFAGGEPTFVKPPSEMKEQIQNEMRSAVEVAKRVRAKWCTVVPGAYVKNAPMEYQLANMIDNLRYAAEILEPAGLCAVLEPLNPWRDHPGLVLSTIPQGYLVCRGVNSPSVKILDDLYHQQITEGNLSGNMQKAWDEIGYIQVGDHPGRKEPGTGEIQYRFLFRWLKKKGYTGIVGMEHGNAEPGKEGERALIERYREADS